MITALEEENIEDLPCSICLDENTYTDNEIIFCDKCSIPVHQTCYGVAVVPEGQWFCDVCRAGEDPAITVCCLCSSTGGAYKRTDTPNTWAHSMCSSWIPDCFVALNAKKEPIINCSSIDKARFKLKCVICAKPGVCIQCASGRCRTAMHPYCALTRKDLNFPHRVVKSLDIQGSYDWEVFCPQHADAVRDPVKPKLKGKKLAELLAANASDSDASDNGNRKGKKSKGVSGKNSSARGGAKQENSLLNGEYSDSDYSRDGETTKKKRGSSAGRKGRPRGSTGRASFTPQPPSPAPPVENAVPSDPCAILNLSDWPGQAEGEPLDLQHFWNVVSMMYPEDRSAETTKLMVNPLLEMEKKRPFEQFPPSLGNFADTMKRLAAGDEELISSTLGTEKERLNSTDDWKMTQLLGNIASAVASLEGGGGAAGYKDEEDEEEGQPTAANPSSANNKDETATAFDLTPMEYFTLSDMEKACMDTKGADGGFMKTLAATMPVACCDGERRLCVVFDGSSPKHKRMACVYGICACGCPAKPEDFESVVDLKDIESRNINNYLITAVSTWEDDDACVLTGSESLVQSPSGCSGQGLDSGRVRLLTMMDVPDGAVLPMRHKMLTSRHDEDELCTYMRRDMKAYVALLNGIGKKVNSVLQSEKVRVCEGKNAISKREMESIEQRYLSQRVWKRIALCMQRGVRDQLPDFNRPLHDAVPASWTIKAAGRADIIAAAEQAPVDEDGKEPHEDTVCMVCFDGCSSDGNSIIFCDGCNSPAHQMCYGIVDIPEGDYYCDRCRAVQALADEYEDLNEICVIKDIYKCCLCPLYHGAMKPTTDGRWVHLCCAIWCGSAASIVGLQEITAVDISGVPISSLAVGNSSSSGSNRAARAEEKEKARQQQMVTVSEMELSNLDGAVTKSLHSTQSIVEEAALAAATEILTEAPLDTCAVCNLSMGHLSRCSHLDGASCWRSVHPLCAWFAGLYVCCEITDPTFMAMDRDDRKYPAGLKLSVLCPEHSVPADPSTDIYRSGQLDIRKQYRILEDDLNYIPGMKRKKSSKTQKKKKKTETVSMVVGGNSGSKDLPEDVFDGSLCAMCFQPTKPLLASCGGESSSECSAGMHTISCSCCNLVVHRSCAQNTSSAIGDVYSTLCSVQVAPMSINTVQQPIVNVVANEPSVPDPIKVDEAVSSSEKAETSELMKMCPETATSDVLVVSSGQQKSPSAEQCTTSGMDVANEGAHAASIIAEIQTEVFVVPASESTISYLTDLTVPLPSSTAGEANSLSENKRLSLSHWTCDVCICRLTGELQDGTGEARCQLCPRRGGMLVRTQYGKWIHGLCARHLCSVAKDPNPLHGAPCSEVITIKNVPGGKKQNCSVCNRKSGVCVQCSHPECSVLFHATCAQRTGSHFLRLANGTKEHFCPAHIPPQVYRLVVPPGPSGSVYWVNAQEIRQLRISLDRARVLMDIVVKRERTRRALIKVDQDVYEKKFKSLCRRLSNNYNADVSIYAAYTAAQKASAEASAVAVENGEAANSGDVTPAGDGEEEVPATMEISEETMLVDGSELVQEASPRPAESQETREPPVAVHGFETREGAETDLPPFPPRPLPPPEMTDVMRELFGLTGLGELNALGGGEDDDDDDVDVPEFDVYSNNMILSPGLMKQKKADLMGDKSAVSVSKRVRRPPGGNEDFISQLVGHPHAAAIETPSAKPTSKRGRQQSGHEDNVVHMVPPVRPENSEVHAVEGDRKRVAGKPRVSEGGGTRKLQESRVVADSKQFQLLLDDEDSPQTVDVSSIWTTRYSRRDADEFDMYLSSSDAKYMLDLPKLQSIIVDVTGQKYRSADVADTADVHLRNVRNDVDKSMLEYRQIFRDQKHVDEFDHELGGYLDYCLSISEKELQKDLNRSGFIKVNRSKIRASAAPAAPPQAVSPVATAGRGKKKAAADVVDISPPPSAAPSLKAAARGSKQTKIDSMFLSKSGGEKPAPITPAEVVNKGTKRKADVSLTSELMSTPSKKSKDAPFVLASPTARPLAHHSEEAVTLADCLKAMFVKHGFVGSTTSRGKGKQWTGFSDILGDVFAADSTATTAMPEASLEVLKVYFVEEPTSPEDLTTLEYKCDYILRRVEDFSVPEGVEKTHEPEKYLLSVSGEARSMKGANKKNKKPAAVSAEQAEDRRVLAKDYINFLYEDSSEVRAELGIQSAPVCLALLHDQVQSHKFTSLWEFASSYFTMLNIFRRVSHSGTKIWWDTALLGALFEQALAECSVPGGADSKLSQTITDLQVDTSTKSSSSGPAASAECFWCEKKFRSSNWPIASQTEAADCVSFHGESGNSSNVGNKRKSKGVAAAQWAWLCPECLHQRGNELAGCPVRVWWTDDAVYYDGIIVELDSHSMSHRVQYSDDEWEFVNLAVEPYVVQVEKRAAPSLSQKGKQGSCAISISSSSVPASAPPLLLGSRSSSRSRN